MVDRMNGGRDTGENDKDKEKRGEEGEGGIRISRT